MNEFNVLVIDDDPKVLEAYQSILNPSGMTFGQKLNIFEDQSYSDDHRALQNGDNTIFRTTTVQQGLEGIEAVSSAIAGGSPYALVFIDMRMQPGIDGLETAQRILAVDPQIETAIVTAYADKTLQEMDQKLGENRFLLLKKPFDRDELIQMAKFLTFRWKLAQINRSYERFVPKQFLKLMEKTNILEVNIGDHVNKYLSILFADIRSFTNLSATLSPKETFSFLNSYLGKMGPIIRNHNGIIDKYIGDAIMGIFDAKPDDAVDAAISMRSRLFEYNQGRKRAGYSPIEIGIGINTGDVMLGTLGEGQRMDGSVVSDAVNLASRLEGLTKRYGVGILISENTIGSLSDPARYLARIIDRVTFKGNMRSVVVHEVFDADPPEVKEAKQATRTRFDEAIALYHSNQFTAAQKMFREIYALSPKDRVVQHYLKRRQVSGRDDGENEGESILYV